MVGGGAHLNPAARDLTGPQQHCLVVSTCSGKFCMGGCFCSLDQTHSECESTLVKIMSSRPRNSVTTKKEKRSSPKTEEFLSPKSSEDKKEKKRSSPQFGTKIGWNLWNLFVLPGPFSSVQPALKPRWGDASPLQFKRCLLYSVA